MKGNKYKLVSVRYNTKSDGETNCWRVICDGVEYLTNKVVVKGRVDTTKDWMGKPIGFKHHISVSNAFVDYGVDYTLIQSCDKRLFKDILKTITYRILGTSVTFGIGYITTSSVSVAVTLGFSDLILKPLVYFIHERLWGLYKN
jgi:uncharacterized membrane protein